MHENVYFRLKNQRIASTWSTVQQNMSTP